MTILGRPVRRYVANLARLPWVLRDASRAVGIFADPWTVLSCYLRKRRPRAGVIALRSGMRIHLSDDPLDVITVFGVFVRRDYGEVAAGSSVVDIGANIGVFTLYAAHCGARCVHAYEPSAEAFACLVRNVAENGLQSCISVVQSAIGGGPAGFVSFPRRSSVFNKLGGEPRGECDQVPLETIETVLDRMTHPDLIKLDCEGEEERILASAPAAVLQRVGAIRLEFHHGRGDAVSAEVERRGFIVEYRWDADAAGGLIWFKRRGNGLGSV
jgi:FkbM family methyltransferase